MPATSGRSASTTAVRSTSPAPARSSRWSTSAATTAVASPDRGSPRGSCRTPSRVTTGRRYAYRRRRQPGRNSAFCPARNGVPPAVAGGTPLRLLAREARAHPAGRVPIPQRALLGDALLGGVVDPHNAEPLLVAVRPLEVVHQRPGEVSADVRTDLPGGGDRGDVRREVFGTVVVTHESGLV